MGGDALSDIKEVVLTIGNDEGSIHNSKGKIKVVVKKLNNTYAMEHLFLLIYLGFL